MISPSMAGRLLFTLRRTLSASGLGFSHAGIMRMRLQGHLETATFLAVSQSETLQILDRKLQTPIDVAKGKSYNLQRYLLLERLCIANILF